MAPAVIIAGITAASAVAGAGVSAYSAHEQGQQQKAAADFQAKELQQQAMEAQMSAGLQASAQDERALHLISSISATAAASGVDPTSGSALEVTKTSSEQAKLNSMYTRYAGNLQAQGLQSQSELETYGGKNAVTASYYTMGGDIVSGVGSLAGMAAKGYFGKQFQIQ